MAKNGCIICGADLVYLSKSELMECSICKKECLSNAKCINGHFICDSCHEKDGFDYILQFCRNSITTNPAELANAIMGNPKIKMHGPEHHFLVPAVLLTSYYNKTGEPDLITEKLKVAKERAQNILGGFCGFYGNCGAAVGTGIFMSIILNANPLSGEEWGLSNLITAETLLKVANNGGPRCCKRNTYLALKIAVDFLKTHQNIALDIGEIKCRFFAQNKECKKKECKFFP